MIKIYKTIGLLSLLTFLCFSGCQAVFLGPDSTGSYIELENNPITPEKALSLAEPYLHKHYQLQLSNGIWKPKGEPEDWVFLKGNWYYIERDNYPYKDTFQYYRNSTIKVHKITGEIVELR